MITFIGVLLLIAAVLLLTANIGIKVYNSYALKEYNEELKYHNEKPEYRGKPQEVIKRGSILPSYVAGILFVVSFIFLTNPIGNNDGGYRVVVENKITKNMWVQFDQGWYFKGFFSKTTTYPNVVTIMFKDLEEGEDIPNITSFNPAFKIRFSDATKADAEATVRWRLPGSEVDMILVHKEFRSATRLAEVSLVKYTKECLKFGAQLMESETHYSGGMSKLSEDFLSQLEEGQYVVDYKTEYVKDTLSQEARKLTTTFVREDENKVPVRKKSNILNLNLKIAFASVDNIDYDEQVDRKLAKKIEASTQESISKQELITAQQEALTEAARGQQKIAKKKADETASKVEEVIRAEKKVELERLAKLQAKEHAQKIVYEGDAKAAANRALVKAGLTPQQEMEMNIRIADVVSKNIAQASTPSVVIMSGDQGAADEVMKVFGAERSLELIKKMGVMNKK